MLVRVRETDFWQRMDEALGRTRARTLATDLVIADLGGRTVSEALAAGVPVKEIWTAVWRSQGLPARLR